MRIPLEKRAERLGYMVVGGIAEFPALPLVGVVLQWICHSATAVPPRAGIKRRVALLHGSLKQLPWESDTESAADNSVAKLRGEETAELSRLRAAEAATDVTKMVDDLPSTTTAAIQLLRVLDTSELTGKNAAMAIQKAGRHSDVSIRDLFEQFLPPEARIKRLGSAVQPEQTLSVRGNIEPARQIFFNTGGVSCKNCHRIGKQGKEVGPEQAKIETKLKREELLESILELSKKNDPKFVTHLAEMTSGKIYSGLLVAKNDDEVILKGAEDKVRSLQTANIEQFVPQRQSLMPDLLVRDMTAEQVTDLLAFLGSLK